jgi:hypothetical protein
MALADRVADIIANWPLNEASGTRASAIGSFNLTDNNTVGSASGVFGTAADFEEGSSEYLSRPSNDNTLDINDTLWMIRVLVKLESKATTQVIASQFDSDDGDNGRAWILFYNSADDRFYFRVNAISGSADVVANNFGAPSAGTTYLIHAWHDPTANKIHISVNAGTADETASVSGGANGNVSGIFRVGAYEAGGEAVALFFDGLIEDLTILQGTVLDATERTADYNAGSFISVADWDGAAPLDDYDWQIQHPQPDRSPVKVVAY